ncbi:MAG TPA: BACON domain-containing carbohydrate-binding protein, partial [Pyrinomonadaceae bacterium]
MKKLLFALGSCALLFPLLLPPALAHKPAGAQKEARSDAAQTATPAPRRDRDPAPRPQTARPRVPPTGAARPDETRPKAFGRRGGRAARRTQDPVPGETQGGEARLGAGESVAPEEYNGDVRNLPQVPALPKIEFEPKEPPSSRRMPLGRVTTEVQPNVGLAPMPTPKQNFAGLSSNSIVTGGFAGAGIPPDINGEVGLNHYVQAVNSSWAIYSKTGTLLAAFTENSLWANTSSTTPCKGSNQGDPVVIYDQFADRWILTNFAFDTGGGEPASPFYQCFAVSKTGDPVSGGWWLYAFRMDTGGTNSPPVGTLNDYPKFGNWNDGCLYMAANGFLGGNYSGALFASFNKSDIESGASTSFALGFISGGTSSMLPSNISGARDAAALPPAGTPNYFVSQSNSQFAYEVRKFTPGTRCTATGASLSAPVSVSQGTFFSPNDGASNNIVPQASTTNMLDSLGARLMQKAQYRRVGAAESLWITHTVRTASQSGPTSPQWAQLNVTGGTVAATPVQQQIYKPDSTLYRWMGSIAADRAGNVALGYSASSATSFPAIAYSGRLVTDPLNNLSQTETQLIAGAGSQTLSDFDGFVHRWGDYTAMSVDPADDCTFWYTNQYYSSPSNGSSGNWQTQIGAFSFPSCTGAPSCTYSIAPTSNSVGAGGTTGSVTVTTTAGCAWTAVSNSSFITITAGANGTGNGTVSYSVAANTTSSQRTGTLTVAGQTFTVTQAAGSCPTTALGFGQTVSGALATTDCRATNRSASYADRYTFTGTAGQQIAVSMSATAFDTYLYLLGPSGAITALDDDGGGGTNSRIPATSGFFSLPASGTYTIEATSFAADATGSYTLALTTQVPCTYSIAPTAQSFAAAGGSNTVAVTAGTGCAWTAVSNSSFITITAGSSGTGSGTVSYSVAANTSTSARNGTMTIAGQTFTVTQAGAACTYSIAPTSQSFTAAAGTGSVSVTAGAGCAWTAVSNDSFLTITSGASGTGNGTVNYSVAANTTSSQRTGTLTIAGQTFTVTQAAGGSSGGCTTTPISVGQTVNGTLATTDCVFSDGAFYDQYTFNGAAGQQVSVTMTAGFDTFLILLAPDGTVLAADDDGGGGTNSRIPPGSGFITLPASGTYTIIANSFFSSVTGSYTLTLTGSAPLGTLQFSAASYGFSEGGNSATITVTRTGSTAGSATVAYSTVDDPAAIPCSTINGTAYARCDYATTLDTLVFAPGETSKTFSIPLIDDAYAEGAETAQLRLLNPAGAVLGAQTTATLTITDNDAPGAPNPIFT